MLGSRGSIHQGRQRRFENQEGQQTWDHPETGWKEPQTMVDSKQSLSPRPIETLALLEQVRSSSPTPHEVEMEQTNSNSRLSSSPHHHHHHHLIPPNLESRPSRPDQRNNYSGMVRKVGRRQAPRTTLDERTFEKNGEPSTTIYHGKRSQETNTPSDYIQIGHNGSLHMHKKIEGEDGIFVRKIAIGNHGPIYLAESRQNTGEESTSDAIKNLKEYNASTKAMESTPELDETRLHSNKNRASPDSFLDFRDVVKTPKNTPTNTSRDDYAPLAKKDADNNEIELLNRFNSFPSIGESDHLPEGRTISVVTEKVGEEDMGLFPEPVKRFKKSPKTPSTAERTVRELDEVRLRSSRIRSNPVDLDEEVEDSRLSGPIDLDEVYDEWANVGEKGNNSTQRETRSVYSSASPTRVSTKLVPKLKANKRDTSPVNVRGKQYRIDEQSSPVEKPEQYGQFLDDDHSETFSLNRSPLKSPAESTTKQQGWDYQGHMDQQTVDEILRTRSASPVFEDTVETLSSGEIETIEHGKLRSTMLGSEHSPRIIQGDPRELLRQLSKSPISLMMSSSVDSGQRRNSSPPQPEQWPNRQDMGTSTLADPMHVGERIDSKENEDEEEDSLFSFNEKASGRLSQIKRGQYARQQTAMTSREEDQHRDHHLGKQRLEKRGRERCSTGRLEDNELQERARQRSIFDVVKSDDDDDDEKEDRQRRDRSVRDMLSSRHPNYHGNDRSTRQDDEDDDDVVDEGERSLPIRDRYTPERRSAERGIKEERPPYKSEDRSSEFMGHVPEDYGCQHGSFFQRLSECAAPMMGAELGDLPASHLAFLRDYPTSAPARQGHGNTNTDFSGHPENIVEKEAEYETEPGVDLRELNSLKLKEMDSLDDNRFNSQKRNGSVVSDDIGAKTAYLELIGIKTAVSSTRKKRRSSSGRGDARSTVSTLSLNQSEKWKAFMERKKAGGGSNSVATSSNRSHVTDVSKAAERYVAAKVQDIMMKMPKGLPRPKSTPRVGRNENYMNHQQVLERGPIQVARWS